MIRTTFKVNNLLLAIILILGILPSIYVGSFGMPVLYLLLPIGVLLLLFVLLGRVSIPRFTKVIVLLSFLILVEIMISTVYGTITTLNRFDFPTDSVQYIARYLTLLSFLIWFYKGNIEIDT